MNLLITLGHNSSAILVDNDGNVINGIEEERLSRKKSDSSFPRRAIEHVITKEDKTKYLLDNIYISHWFDNFDFFVDYWADKKSEKIAKYLNFEYLDDLINENPGCKLNMLDDQFTHHDAHAYSAMAFYENFEITSQFEMVDKPDYHIIVADGFGNQQEVFTIYHVSFDEDGNKDIQLLQKSYGYQNSLGLLYQYATAFTGMKENKDEWKYLAYESHIKEVISYKEIKAISEYAQSYAAVLVNNLLKYTNKSRVNISNELINLEDLAKCKTQIFNDLTIVLKLLEKKPIDQFTEYEKRVIIGFFVQSVIEKVLAEYIRIYDIQNLLVAGGLFYNVKLNNKCTSELPGKFCAIPAAGDQGAAIGAYYRDFGVFKYGNGCWGKRTLEVPLQKLPERTLFFSNKENLAKMAVQLLKDNKLVQIVVGNAEFGPRALCHTSTLFIPSKDNAAINDTQNDRLSLMPLGPVLLQRNMDFFFDEKDFSKVVGSDRYMIVTYDYKDNKLILNYQGVMHKYPQEEKFSGRPQIIRDEKSTIFSILDGVDKELGIKALVNTSFNVHSEPIVYSVDDAINNFRFQQEHCQKEHLDKTYLLIGTYEE